MLVKIGNHIFNSDDEPVLILFNDKELYDMPRPCPGNETMFVFSEDSIKKPDAWKLATQMNRDLLAERERLSKKEIPLIPIPTSDPVVAKPTKLPPSHPAQKVVDDKDILELAGVVDLPEISKVEKDGENDLTLATDSDILKMTGLIPDENTTKKSEVVLDGTFEVKSQDNKQGTPDAHTN